MLVGKILSIIIFGGIFIFTLLQVPYPETLIQANAKQLLLFFIPLSLALTTTFNFLLKNIPLSFSISLGLILLLVLMALDALNLVTGVLIVIAISLLISYFAKTRSKSLTNHSKIPKLTQLRRKRV